MRIKLRLYPGEDDDLIAFSASVPHTLRATTVKRALRSGGLGQDDEATDADDDLLDPLESLTD